MDAVKTEFSAKEVEATTSNLTPLQRRNIRRLLRLDENALMSAGDALVYWVADMLSGTHVCDEASAAFILTDVASDLASFGDKLARALAAADDKTPVMFISFGDRRYVSVSGRVSFVDLKTGSDVDSLKVQFVEAVTYNLTALFVRQLARVNQHARSSKPACAV